MDLVELQPVEIDLLCSFHIFGRVYLSDECCHLLSTLVLRICSSEVFLLRKIFCSLAINYHLFNSRIVTVCVFVRHLFSFYPFYFNFHSTQRDICKRC